MARALVGSVVQLTQGNRRTYEFKDLTKLLLQAAKIIEDVAECVKQSETINGKWVLASLADKKAKRDYDRMMRVASRLRRASGVAPKGRKAA